MKNIILLISFFIFSNFSVNDQVKKFGFYTNEKSSDGEHSIGYTVQLWKYQNSFIGKMAYNQGLIGDQEEGFIKNVKYNMTSGDLNFDSELSGEKITFIGKINDRKLVGTITRKNRADKNQTLTKCCSDAPINVDYPTIKAWQNMWKQFEK